MFFFIPVNRPKPLPGIRIRLPTASFYSRGATPPPAALRGLELQVFYVNGFYKMVDAMCFFLCMVVHVYISRCQGKLLDARDV